MKYYLIRISITGNTNWMTYEKRLKYHINLPFLTLMTLSAELLATGKERFDGTW